MRSGVSQKFAIATVLAASTFLSFESHADEYLTLTHYAYCLGVAAKNVELLSRYSLPSANDGNKAARNRAILNGAVKLQKIDEDTIKSLAAAGSADALLCNTEQEKCDKQAFQSALKDKSMTPEQIQIREESCMKFAGNEACKRAADCP